MVWYGDGTGGSNNICTRNNDNNIAIRAAEKGSSNISSPGDRKDNNVITLDDDCSNIKKTVLNSFLANNIKSRKVIGSISSQPISSVNAR